jgi:hypothetical protein
VSPSGFMGYGIAKAEDSPTADPRAALSRAAFRNRSPSSKKLYWAGPEGNVFQADIATNEELIMDT